MSEQTYVIAPRHDKCAFHEQINIEMFNDVATFIMNTSAKETSQLLRRLNSGHPWFCFSNNKNIQEQYGFRYLGELLERIEDKVQLERRDIRAIALALAQTEDLITDDMFVGNQHASFLQKIKRLSPDDVYLKGALYLLDKKNSGAYYNEMTQATYTRTEELLFVISLFDEFENAFKLFKPQLLNLLGTARTIPVIGNVGIISWLLKMLPPVLDSVKTKDMALLRALAALPVSYVKADSRQHSILIENGYTADEIAYANSSILLYRPVRDTIGMHTLLAEKIVVEMCRIFLSSDKTHSPETYQYLEWIINKYKEFDVKYNDARTLLEALRRDISLTNPATFVLLYVHWYEKAPSLFLFDILDEKWDSLADMLCKEKYQKLFDNQLLNMGENSAADIMERIRKYDRLTGNTYLGSFNGEYDDYTHGRVFCLLVNKDLIEITKILEVSKEKVRHSEVKTLQGLRYVGEYVKGIHTKKAYEFLRQFLSEFGFDGLSSLWNEDYHFSRALFETETSNRSAQLTLRREFLTPDEHCQLYKWLDEYLFLYQTSDYLSFAIAVLQDKNIESFIPFEDRRALFNVIYRLDPQKIYYGKSLLKQKYQSEEELKAEKDAEDARRLEEARLEREKEAQDQRDCFSRMCNGSFKSLADFLKKYQNNNDLMKTAQENVAGAIDSTLAGADYQLGADELNQFVLLCGQLIMKGSLDLGGFINHLLKIKEVTANVDAGNDGSDDLDSNADECWDECGSGSED